MTCGGRPLRWSRKVALLGALTLLGCEPSLPDRAQAEAWYEEREDRVSRVEGALRGELVAVPYFGARDPGCELPEATEAEPLGGVLVQASCHIQSQERIRERTEALRRVEERFGSITDDAGVLGGAASFRYPGETDIQSLGRVPPATPGFRNGTVRAEDGTTRDGRQLGWGRYQTAWEADGVPHGDGDYHPGIEVLSTFEVAGAEVELRLFFLMD